MMASESGPPDSTQTPTPTPSPYVYSLIVKAMLCSGEYGDEWSWGIEHHFGGKTGTLADTMRVVGRVAPSAEAERCQRIDFVLVVYRRLAKHGGRGKLVQERELARVYATDPDDVLDRCLAIMPWRELRPELDGDPKATKGKQAGRMVRDPRTLLIPLIPP